MKLKLTLLTLLLASGVAHSATIVYSNIILSGAIEVPVNASPGTGTATITVDTTLNTMRVEAAFSGLLGTTTNAHIHASSSFVPFNAGGTAGVATQTPTFSGFPAGVTSGTYDQTFDMTLPASFNAAYITANGGTPASAWTALQSQMATGRAYLNIHSSFATGGEIRGFIPEPTSAGLLGLSCLGLVLGRRKRQ